MCDSSVCVSSVCVSSVYLSVGPQRGLSCFEGDLASVELSFESVVLLLVCVTMTIIIIIMTTIIMRSPVQGVYLNLQF